MLQQTGREIFPALAKAVLPLQQAAQLLEVSCHPSPLGRDLQVQKFCLLWYEKVSRDSVDITSDQVAGTMQIAHGKQQHRVFSRYLQSLSQCE